VIIFSFGTFDLIFHKPMVRTNFIIEHFKKNFYFIIEKEPVNFADNKKEPILLDSLKRASLKRASFYKC